MLNTWTEFFFKITILSPIEIETVLFKRSAWRKLIIAENILYKILI